MENTISVVLIENHDITRMGLKAAFHQAGLRILGEATTGEQGLPLLLSSQPRVGVINIDLPDMDGIELIRRFRQMCADRPTQLLVLTDDCSDRAVMSAFEAGASSFCTKAIDNTALIAAIQATDAGQTWIDPCVANVVVSRARTSAGAVGTAAMPLTQETIEIRAMEPDYAQILKAYPLTDREMEILGCIVAGCSNAQISEKLFVTVGTVKTHVRNILTKLGANDRTQAAVRALRSGLVS